MRFVIGLVSFYALLFAVPRWGWEGVIVIILVALTADWLWRDHVKAAEKQRKEEERQRREKHDRERVANFLGHGCGFYGHNLTIWQFEHRYDLVRSMVAKEMASLTRDQFRVLQTSDGFVLAHCRRGWPEAISDWDAIEILKILIEKRVPEQKRDISRYPTSPEAIAADERKRQEHLAAVEERVISRAADFNSRTASDMGEEATAVYVIATPAQNSVKVGISDNPDRRRNDLQTGSPHSLAVYCQFWLQNRQHALLVERHCHKRLKARGHFTIGEWFSVEPDVAKRHIVETYVELTEQRAIIEHPPNASPQSTDDELKQEFSQFIRWRFSKRGNLVADIFGQKITVYQRHKQWRWVCDGTFSKGSFDNCELAQFSAISYVNPPREMMLNLMLGTKSS
jgi:T5orf172 domain